MHRWAKLKYLCIIALFPHFHIHHITTKKVAFHLFLLLLGILTDIQETRKALLSFGVTASPIRHPRNKKVLLLFIDYKREEVVDSKTIERFEFWWTRYINYDMDVHGGAPMMQKETQSTRTDHHHHAKKN